MSAAIGAQTMEQYTSELPQALYRTEQVRALDAAIIESGVLTGFALMARAAAAVVARIEAEWSPPLAVQVLCGHGNNAGDGYLIAALLHQRGFAVTIIRVGDPQQLGPDARRAFELAQAQGVAMQRWEEVRTQPAAADAAPALDAPLLVDALLGTGLHGSVRAPYDAVIAALNAASGRIIAVDIPSGLNADTGQPLGAAVQAAITVTFIAMKQGLLTGAAPDHCGELLFAGLGVPRACFEAFNAAATRTDQALLAQLLPVRARSSHKGSHGHVVIIGGDIGMGGAVAMAAEAAARSGAGLVTVLTRQEHIAPILSRRPEVMVVPVEVGTDISRWLQRANCVVVGPGLGQAGWGEQLLQQALAVSGPVLVDADGLNLIAARADCRRENWILTPHPGEAARLLRTSTAMVQQDRFESVQRLARDYQATVVLKGAGSLVAADAEEIIVCDAGNPGMGSGGMGDVLSGVIGALLAQGLAAPQAAAAGVFCHAQAGDAAAAAGGERGLLATDLFAYLQQAVNPK